MPQLGEIQRGKALGKIGAVASFKFIWVKCKDCDKERWTQLGYKNKPQSVRCVECQRKMLRTPEVCRKISIAVKALGRSGSKHPNWKGGRIKDREGYIHIKYGREGFFSPMAGNNGYIREHRLVMAQSLKRCLLPWEIVHHKNGNKEDNRLENLAFLRGQIYHAGINIVLKENKKLCEQIQYLEAEVKRLQDERD